MKEKNRFVPRWFFSIWASIEEKSTYESRSVVIGGKIKWQKDEWFT